MSRLRLAPVLIATFTAVVLLTAQEPSPAVALFQQGLLLERAEGDLPRALVLFERVVAEYPKDAVTPQVIAHLAAMYEGRDNGRAAQLWARLASEYGSTPYAEQARRRLAAIDAQAAGPFRARPLEAIARIYDDSSVEFSPDGRAIAYLTNEASQLRVRDIDSGGERTLLDLKGRHIDNLRWSPDGRFLACTSREPSDPAMPAIAKPNGSHDVRIVAAASGQPRTVATAESGNGRFDRGDWSPDSRWFVLTFGATTSASGGEIRLVDATTYASRTLVSPATPTSFVWSADSRDVAFSAPGPVPGAGGPSTAFWIASVATAQVRPLNISLDPGDGWVNLAIGVTGKMTTDGRVLVRQQGGARASGNRFYLVDPTGGAADPVCTSLAPMQCSGGMTPDGRFRLGRDDSTQRLLLFDRSKGGAPSRLTNGFADEDKPFLSPDGRVVLFASNPDGDWALYALPLDRAPLARPLRVTSLGTTDLAVEAWSPDGRMLLNVYHDDSQVFRINVDRGGHPIGPAGRLTKGGRVNDHPVISPDSKMVAYYSNNARSIAIVNADGIGERPIGQPEINRFRHLEWHPSGRLIFQKPGRTPNEISVATLDMNTDAVEPLVAVPGDGEPVLAAHWQYVGARRELFYVSNAMGGLVLHAKAVDTGVDRVVAMIPWAVFSGFTFRVSPDATQIAYGKWSGADAENSRHPELHVMTISGQDDRTLPTSMLGGKDWDSKRPAGLPYDWSPDGRLLLYDEYPGRLMVINVQSGESWPIAEAVNSDRVRWSGVQWSRDGSFIVLQRDETKREFLQLEGLTYENIVKLMESKK